jgi:orotate phosphoribosyltransferase
MPDVIIGNPLGELANHAEYEKAKAGDTISAIHTVRDLVTPEFTEKIKQAIGNKEVILQPVMATESSGDNQIPAAMVVKLSEELGHQVGETIYQSTSPKRTGLSGLDRIFNRPEFDGEVEQGKSYFLVDDTVTQGGTFAALSDHIERNGGHVIGSATLTGKQYSAKISLSDQTLGNIREKHGDIEQQFKSSKGYGFDALTESEARYLANYKPTDTIRSRILAEEQSSHHDDGKNGLPQSKIESKFSPQREAQDEFAPRNEGVTPENSASKVKGMLSKILRVPAEFIKSPLDRIGTAVIPMSMGSESAQVVATKFADAGRQARQQWNKFDEIIVKEFTKEQQEKMWDAADQENDLRRDGVTSQDKGLNSLEPRERQVVEFLHAYGEHLLKRATDNGMFDGEGVAYWTPRMVMLVDEDGRLHMPKSDGPFEGSKDARNLRTTASSLKQRKYLTSAETEAAAQGMNEEGKTATIVRNIRTMPMAMARLEAAVAGRELVNQVKAIGESTGVDAVSEYKAGDKNYFTMDHPALRKTSVEMIEDPDTGKMRARLDENGDVITKRVPLYISKEFEGPLRAVLNRESLPGYQAIMNLKSKSMGLIMMSPAIHLAVEYGRSAPAMLTSVSKADAGKNLATLGIYTFVVGHQAKQNDAIMKDFIAHGLVPLGGRGFNADINGIADGSSMEVGKSWTAKALGSAVDLINKQAGDKVRAGVDKAGDFWHGTLLWNRIADLQMGLAVTIKTSLINKGLDEYTATTLASHMANRYAGALPAEAMGQYAREIANTVMFSRSFTLGNMGLMKDMVNGLPPNRQAMIKAAAVEAAKAIGKADAEANKSGDDTLSQAKKIAKSKARQTVVLDIALAYAANAIVQAYFENEETHKTWADQLDKFGERFNELKSKSLIDIVSHPFTSLESLTPQGHNPEGHRNRARLGDDKDGSTIYVRVPFGKVGEELEAYSSLSTAAKLLGSKLSPMVSGGFQAITGKDHFDHSIYGDHDAAGIQIGKAAWHFMKAQIPYDQLVAFKDIAAGKADDIDKKKALGPFVGLTYSKVTGGDELAEEYKVMRDFQDRKVNAMPDVKRALKEGDEDKARELLIDIGMSPKEAIGAINRAQNPSKPMSPGSYKKMYQHATEDQKQSINEIK